MALAHASAATSRVWVSSFVMRWLQCRPEGSQAPFKDIATTKKALDLDQGRMPGLAGLAQTEANLENDSAARK